MQFALPPRVAAVLACLALAGLPPPASAAAPALPQQLVGAVKQLSAELSDLGGSIALDQQALVAQVSQGNSFATADFPNGTFKGQAEAAPNGVDFMMAATAFDLRVTNTSAASILFPSTAIGLDLNASFSRSLGAAAIGTVGNTINAIFSIAIVAPDKSTRYTGYGLYQYLYTLDAQDGVPALTPSVQSDGGFSVTNSEDADQAVASLRAPTLTLLPGETLGLVVSVFGSAQVLNFLGAPGFSATTDFGHTAQLHMQLPAGVEFVGAVPVSWISAAPVPEPQTWALLLAGLGCLALRRRARA